MRQPPDEQEQDEQHAIHAIKSSHMTLFPIPAPTFEILKSRFDAHPSTILRESLSTRGSVRNHQQSLLFLLIPAPTQVGLNLLVLPQSDVPIKALARTINQLRDRTGRQEPSLR